MTRAGQCLGIRQREPEAVDDHRRGSCNCRGWRRRGSCRTGSRAGTPPSPWAVRRTPPKPMSLLFSGQERALSGPCSAPVTCFQPRSVRNRWSPLATSLRAVLQRDPVRGLDRGPVRQHLGDRVTAVVPVAHRPVDRVAHCDVSERLASSRLPSGLAYLPSQAVSAGMLASPVRVDRPAEGHARGLGDVRRRSTWRGPRRRSCRGSPACRRSARRRSRANIGSCPWPPSPEAESAESSRRLSQRMFHSLERLFDHGKHQFGDCLAEETTNYPMILL